jgi:predicted secreted protein
MDLRRFRQIARIMAVVWFGLLPWGTAIAEPIPALPEISPATATAYPDIASRRLELVSERNGLRERTRQHNSGPCRSVVENSPEAASCDRARETLASDINRHIEASKQFIVERHLIDSMNLMAKNQGGWSEPELTRLDAALNTLKPDGDPNVTNIEIRQTWRDVLSRGQAQEFAREAAKGDGLGLYGAGEQTRHQDCAIFALATATGRPYGAVAAQATALVGAGEWRSAAERAEPQKAIEQRGLKGGEVIMLAEVFGQVEVVRSTEFTAILQGGRPVMVNLVPESGNVDRGHQVVLSKAFQHGGETWYEMIDSNQGPLRRLYLSARELEIMLKENGVAFRAEDKTTPMLFR